MFDDWPTWTRTGGLLAGAVLLALIVHAVVFFVARTLALRTHAEVDTLMVKNTNASARVAFVLLALLAALPLVMAPGPGLAQGRQVLGAALIAAVTWMLIRALTVLDDMIMIRHPIHVADNLRARRIHTQVRIFSRTLMVIVTTGGVAAMLMTFSSVRQFGMSLLASAGIAGLAVGLAAQPAMTNLVAGIQLALTQPINLDDVVIIEGEWGWIEEIRSTYVVVKIWDDRRLIVPLQYFIQHPFQNWTRRTSQLLGTVFLHVDYRTPVSVLREELQRICQSSPDWDGRVCVMQVTDASAQTVQIRALVSAENSPKAFELRCLVRERLIAFLQKNHPDCLPRTRAEITSPFGKETPGTEPEA